MKFKLEIVTPERLMFSDDIDVLTTPTTQGEISIMAHHVPLVTMIAPGEIKIKKNKEISFMTVTGGFIQVAMNKVTLLADAAERAEEIDVDRAERARERARKMLAEKHLDSISHTDAVAALQRSLLRLKVARHRTTRGGDYGSAQ
ncbi:MAG TPA: F0F1 ATP synthase subunit epsilon [bacterium]